MRKLLIIITVIILAFTFFYSCTIPTEETNDSSTETPEPEPDNPSPPNIPTSIQIIDDDACFSLTIDWPGVIYAAGYRVYKSNSQNGTYINVSGDIVESEFIDIDILPDITYWYKVKSFNQGGESEFSNPIEFLFPNILLGKWYRDYGSGRNAAFTFYNDMTFFYENNNPFDDPVYKVREGVYNFSLTRIYIEPLEGYDGGWQNPFYGGWWVPSSSGAPSIIFRQVYYKIE